MWVKNVPRCKSSHNPSRGRNNWSMSHRCNVLWSGQWCFVGVILAWNTVFGNLYRELFGAHFIQSSLELNHSHILLVLCHEKAVSCLKKDATETMQAANLLSLRLLNWTDVHISLFSWKHGFLIHHYLGLNQFHQSWSLSGRLDWKQGRIPTLSAAAGYPVPILTWYNLPVWSPPEGSLLLNWACISLHRPHFISLDTQTVKRPHYTLTKERCLFAPSGHAIKISRGLLEVHIQKAKIHIYRVWFLFHCMIISAKEELLSDELDFFRKPKGIWKDLSSIMLLINTYVWKLFNFNVVQSQTWSIQI